MFCRLRVLEVTVDFLKSWMNKSKHKYKVLSNIKHFSYYIYSLLDPKKIACQLSSYDPIYIRN